MRKTPWILSLALLLAACTPSQTRQTVQTEDPALRAAVSAYNTGRYAEAAQRFTQLASHDGLSAETRLDYQLRAIEAQLQAGDRAGAQRRLLALDLSRASPRLQMRGQLLHAELLLESAPDRALQRLATPLAPNSERDLYARYHRLRAAAYNAQQNYLASAQERVAAEGYLVHEGDIVDNQQALWEALSHFSLEELRMLAVEPPPDTLSGWLELLATLQQHRRPGPALDSALLQWRSRYPNHSVRQAVVDSMIASSGKLPDHPRKLALLLPSSGRYARAAAAVRDGFMAAYYHSPELGQTEIRLYDTGNGETVEALYQSAVADGAELVIGPLQKEEVQQLAHLTLSVPVLALNYLDETTNNPDLYLFGLSPESEAEQIAEEAFAQGKRRAAIIAPGGSWGERMVSAFRERWKSLGGVVVAQTLYDPQQNNLSDPLHQMLGLDRSEARKSRLQSQLRLELEFEPRRRDDIDFIFLAAFPREARLIRPLLRFHRATSVPVYATSHLYAAAANPSGDRDLDGIRFVDLPWVLDSATTQAPVREVARRLMPQYNGKLQRLLALGVDAYHLAYSLSALAQSGSAEYYGETGHLSLAEGNQVRLKRDWAQFRDGLPSAVSDTTLTDDMEVQSDEGSEPAEGDGAAAPGNTP